MPTAGTSPPCPGTMFFLAGPSSPSPDPHLPSEGFLGWGKGLCCGWGLNWGRRKSMDDLEEEWLLHPWGHKHPWAGLHVRG
jgi:hypothetical protein